MDNGGYLLKCSSQNGDWHTSLNTSVLLASLSQGRGTSEEHIIDRVISRKSGAREQTVLDAWRGS